ncbi:hypothetical protein ACTXT7_013076 [Hymenolepis weldensis]
MSLDKLNQITNGKENFDNVCWNPELLSICKSITPLDRLKWALDTKLPLFQILNTQAFTSKHLAKFLTAFSKFYGGLCQLCTDKAYHRFLDLSTSLIGSLLSNSYWLNPSAIFCLSITLFYSTSSAFYLYWPLPFSPSL